MRSFNLGFFLTLLVALIAIASIAAIVILLPISLIQLMWNLTFSGVETVPSIALWQAGLLYVAGLLVIYLCGLVKIEIKVEKFQ